MDSVGGVRGTGQQWLAGIQGQELVGQILKIAL